MIYASKISERTTNVNNDKEHEGDFSSKSQNSKHHGENSMTSNEIVVEKIAMDLIPSTKTISSKEGLRSELNKREYPQSGYTLELKKKILDVHNLYRANVTPPAANMEFMEWSDELARLAQLWADNCVFKHGVPEGTNYSKRVYGQNLYLGPDPSGYRATYMWYEEYQHYTLNTNYCKPKQKCGHYTQMAFATSNLLGCGVAKCERGYHVVCHYDSA
ncbi:cysteine-rich secretory protein 2 [Trichonephila inaurata madagascariensis]|uniref:Cysteine-rich secretory protein 2 n=1 Tax=Trichonephila inaurata madagascariensis TaxID=2747483 RepID=A0A8X6KPK5_9ARAC|nr:cysteine-rich secretory protein 2 [Trichonephila inaurata madagascariensis]